MSISSEKTATGHLPFWAIGEFFSQVKMLWEKYTNLFYAAELQYIRISANLHTKEKPLCQEAQPEHLSHCQPYNALLLNMSCKGSGAF